MTSKKLLSALLALVFTLSLFTALPVSAAGVTATVNGNATASGATIPAVSTIVFTLPTAITQADLATAVTFEEIKKGKAAPAEGEAWAKREFDGVVDGNTLTVNFELGDLSMNSQYRFNFVTLGESFTFVTNAKVDSYYINENFDRYPAHERIPAAGVDPTELDTPWWLGVKLYSRSTPAMIRENGDSYMLLTDGSSSSENRSAGSVAFDNRYAPASTANEVNYWGDGKYVAKYEFAIAGNPSSGYDIGPFTIKTDNDGKTRLYLRTNSIPNGSLVTNGTGTYVALGVELASPTDTLTRHTLEYTEELCWGMEYMRRVLSVKFDGKKVNLPLAESATSIGYNAYNSSGAYHPIEQNNLKGLNYVFSVANRFDSANVTEGIQQPANLAVYSYSYADYVPEPLTVSATTASGTAISPVGNLTFTFSEPINAATLATGMVFEEDQLSSGTWKKRACAYELDGEGTTLTVSFDEGDLVPNSNYRFRFTNAVASDSAALAAETIFTYKTTAYGNYYIYDTFDRFPANTSITAPGTSPTELDAPWWQGIKRYGRMMPTFVREGNDTFMRIKSAGTDSDMMGAVSYDNAYAPAYTGNGPHKTVTEVSFAIAGNSSSIYEINGLVIRTDAETGQTGLYYRKSGILGGEYHANVPASTTSLNYPIASPTDQKVTHTLKLVQTYDNTAPQKRTIHHIIFDGVEVPMPNGDIKVELQYWASGQMEEAVINYTGGNGRGHVFSVINSFASANATAGVLGYSEMDVYSFKFADFATKPATVSAGTASGTAISPVSSLIFTFSEKMSASTLANGLVFEEDALGTGTWAGRACNYALGADGKTLTVTFDEGDLAPNSNYRFRFTTAIGSAEASLAEETTFTYSTTAYGDYYVYDTFDRYKEWTLPTSAACEATQLSDTPWYLGIKRYGRLGVAFAKVDGDTVLRVSSAAGPDTTDNYGCVSYNNAYSPVVGAMASHTTVTEIEFTMAGNTTSVYEFGGIVIRTDAETGKTGLYYRTQGNIWGHQSNIAADTASLNFEVATPNAVAARHTIKYVQTIDAADPRSRVFEKIWFDGVEVPMAGPVHVRYNGVEYGQGAGEDIVNLGGGTNLCQLFTATNNMAAASVPAGQQQSTVMDVYSYKCSPAGVNVTIAAGATAQAKSITIANNSGEAFTGVIALAVYDGDTLVGLDGLATTETVANGQNLNITRTVADAANGNTYKVIVLNNKNAVQPVGAAYAGIIG